MKQNQKINLMLSIICWLCTLMVTVLEVYMLRMVKRFPEIDSFARNARLAGALLVVWVAAAIWFTAQTRKEKKK